MSSISRRLKQLGFREALLQHRDDPTSISLEGYSAAELVRWTFVETTLPAAQAKEQSWTLACLGIYAAEFSKGSERWHIRFAVPPTVQLA
jgi:hypothetical protein